MEGIAPAPAVYAAPAPVVEYIAPAPAVYAAQAPVEKYIAPPPAVYAAPAPVEYFAPAPAVYAVQAPVVEYIAPAPAVYAAQAPVVKYIAPAPAVYAVQAPVVLEYIAPAPAVHAAQAPVVEYIAPAPSVYAAQAPHCASTRILLEAFKKSPTMCVAIQTLLSLYGPRERSAACTRVYAVSAMSFSGPSFFGGGVATTSGQQHHLPCRCTASNTILSCRQCSDVPCTQPFGSYLSFCIFRCYSAAAAQLPSMFSVARKEYRRRADIPFCLNEQQQGNNTTATTTTTTHNNTQQHTTTRLDRFVLPFLA